MLDFDTANQMFKDDQIRELSSTSEGMRFLKLRSLSRKDQMQYLIESSNIDVGDTKSKVWLKTLYESDVETSSIDNVIANLYEKEREVRRQHESQLVSELYKVQSFQWGGLHQNSLEKTIVDNYVKRITSFDILNFAIENDLHNSMRAYVLASWYNHWSSIVIEDVFKEHEKVIPAVGLVKKIDFFVNDKPFDLKVTYLPEGYVRDSRKEQGLKPELTLLKSMARRLKIAFDKEVADSVLVPDLWRKLDDSPSDSASELIASLQKNRETLLKECMEKPEHLVRWLYENQGVRRFDASNRLFLVLVDKGDFFESWKLKRARQLIADSVSSYLDKIEQDMGFELEFHWEGKTYTTESAAIFVVKDSKT
ncbi:MAG: hypothetical protein KKG33_10225 [candidate division Zixibacteria bacterium]|nr:hypothetical protein [candidate division Zixibacteria bacterium]MBU1470474.1 hypothetical protein [candidate division Zixibacteria bacterium]MBU2625923.1 hypothetical protein [candidate division Zixibacteria bacterium]